MSQYDKDSAALAAAGWEELARKAVEWAAYLRTRGEYDGVEERKAKTYRIVAMALRLEAETGLVHCQCCMRPITKLHHPGSPEP